MDCANPFLSVVVTGAADRVQAFRQHWNEQAARHGLSSEVLSAESTRNAAIRRARGEFILVTDADVRCNDDLVRFLAEQRLEKGRLYRVDSYIGDNTLCAREGTFALTADGLRRNQPHDIASVDSGVHFGAGWFPAEIGAAGAPFRWIDNNAEIVMRMPGGGRVLALEFEPGPGIAETPAALQAVDADGRPVARWEFSGRIQTELAVPAPRNGDLQRLRLVVTGGGSPLLDDARILNLRFFRCTFAEREEPKNSERAFPEVAREHWPTLARVLTSRRASGGSVSALRRGPAEFRLAARLLESRGADICTAGEEWRFGHGWHGVETAAGERFRWAAQSAELLLRLAHDNYRLGMLVEPGPGLEHRPFVLMVRDAGGAEIARRPIAGLTWIEFPVPMPAGAVAKLIFSVEDKGVAAGGDPRILNYRVLACGAVQGQPVETKPCDVHDCWPALRIDEQPVQTGAPDERIAGMGRPAFLHTNAAGNFLLMSREDWEEIRGIPELDAPSARLDTLLCYTAHFAGVREHILAEPLRIDRIAAPAAQSSGKSCLSEAELQELIVQMRTMRSPVIYNAVPPAPRKTVGPYISVVIAARNDNHGGNMLGRMQAFFDAWIGQAERFGVDSEIVVVEWNPPADRPRLMDAIEWPQRRLPCPVRFIEVSPELHRTFPHADGVPLHQMIAKNVGIRRARGEFVLATNLDIVLSAELMQFFAERRLEPHRCYRLDRCDVAREIPPPGSVEELLAFCQSHRLRVFTAQGDFTFDACGQRKLERDDIVAAEDGIRLGPGWYASEIYDEDRFRWIADEAEIVFTEPPRGRLRIDVDNGPSAGGGGVGIEIVSRDGTIIGSGTVRGRCHLLVDVAGPIADGFRLRVLGGGVPLTHDLRMLNVRVFGLRWQPGGGGIARADLVNVGAPKDWTAFVQAPSPFAARIHDAAYLHTNACGDFTMLARDDWFALRGYPEFPIWPMHIDSLLCYEAHHAGMREVVLRDPMRVFHIEHMSGAGWTPEGEEERRARIARKQVPSMEYDELERWVHRMRRFNAPIIVTRGDWGLGKLDLPESTVKMGTAVPVSNV